MPYFPLIKILWLILKLAKEGEKNQICLWFMSLTINVIYAAVIVTLKYHTDSNREIPEKALDMPESDAFKDFRNFRKRS